MSYHLKKRKRRPFATHGHEDQDEEIQADLSLFIQAHEADLVHGSQAASAARSLEVLLEDGKGKLDVMGDGLIQWMGDRHSINPGLGASDSLSDDEDRLQPQTWPVAIGDATKDRAGCWVDRYDARLLLESLPDVSASPPSTREPSSPGGWSDLPSDAEDTFFFSAEEVEDYRRDKRRRVIDRDREARLIALRAEAGDDPSEDPRGQWGGSDEEPDDTQRELMRRTASHIMLSPNAAQLEMRILANHGADPRFAFLRGRWSRAWRLTKSKLRLALDAEKQHEEDEAKKSGVATLGGLAGYGSSDEDSDEGEGSTAEVHADAVAKPLSSGSGSVPIPDPPVELHTHDEALKAARRARAREWAEKRRAAKEIDEQVRE